MPLWIPIAFTAVLLYVVGNIIDKYLIEDLRDEETNESQPNTLVLFSALFSIPTILIALLMGGGIFVSPIQLVAGISVGLLNGLYLLLYLYAIAESELSRVTPIFQSVPIFTGIMGFFVLGEILTTPQITAGLLVIAGAIILSYERSEEHFRLKPFFLILGSSFAVAIQLTLFKFTALETSYWTGVLLNGVGLAVFGFLIYIFHAHARQHIHKIFREKQYRMIGLNAVNEVIDLLAYFTLLFATTLGPIALVQTVHAYHPVFVFIISALATYFGLKGLQEDISKESMLQKAVGIVCITAGSVYMYQTLIL